MDLDTNELINLIFLNSFQVKTDCYSFNITYMITTLGLHIKVLVGLGPVQPGLHHLYKTIHLIQNTQNDVHIYLAWFAFTLQILGT